VLRAAGERASAIETATPGTYEYTFATDLAAVNTFKYYGAPGYTTNPGTGQSGELTSPAAQAVLASLDLTWDANAITRIGVSSRPGTHPVTLNAIDYPGTAISRYNAVVDFVPAALPQLNTGLERQIATNESCAACHATPSSPALWFDKRNNAFGNVVHTNYRHDVDLCVMCHNANTYDSRGSSDTNWASLDMAIMMHKIHGGEKGYSVDGRSYEFIEDDYSSMRYPLGITDCRACHTNPLVVDSRPAIERDAWKNNPSIEACSTCHTAFVPEQHFTSFSCATCHNPAGIEEVHSR
ncbi:MAG: multiheme c-type cytochrome, partial [Gammaproteobacteria bacterium]